MFERLRRFLGWSDHLRPTDDWARGDLGECINRGAWLQWPSNMPTTGPMFGDLVRVVDVREKHGVVALSVAGWPRWFAACCFRKLWPEQASACDRAFEKQVRKCKPKAPAPRKVGADA